MPRIKPTAQQQRDREILAAIKGFMILQGLDRTAAARRVGLSLSSWQRRMKNPAEFTIAELRSLGMQIDIRGKD